MLPIIIILLGLILDQGTKYLALSLKGAEGSVVLIPKLLNLRYVENRGAAFSMLEGRQWLLIGLTVIVVAVMLVYLIREKHRPVIYRILVSVLIAGALGNLIDRVRLDYVIDFFEFAFVRFAIFNVADVLICCSVAGLCVGYVFFFDRMTGEDKKKKAELARRKETEDEPGGQ